MKFAFTTILIFSFVGAAVFGIVGMNHNGEHGQDGCIAAVANGADCLAENSPISFIVFHFTFFKIFLISTFNNSAIILFLACLAALFLSFTFGIFDNIIGRGLLKPAIYFRARRFLDFLIPISRQKFFSWLALRENSPSF